MHAQPKHGREIRMHATSSSVSREAILAQLTPNLLCFFFLGGGGRGNVLKKTSVNHHGKKLKQLRHSKLMREPARIYAY